MRILITNLTLSSRSGTEIVTRDLALGLKALGHEVVVFSPSHGGLAEEIRAASATVVNRLEEIETPPDVIHGHHHVETTQALLRFPSVPAIFVCHDRNNWHDAPPLLDQVRRFAAVDRNCLERLVREAGVPESKTRLIFNAVNLRRFAPRSGLPATPRRALVFSNYARADTHIEVVQHACRQLSLSLDIVGAGVGNPTDKPEDILRSYDLVFAKARYALEAMAVGNAVVLCDSSGLGPLVIAREVAAMREWNFGKRCLQRPLSTGSIVSEILAYDPADAARVSKWIRANSNLDDAISEYVSLYEEVIQEARRNPVSVTAPQVLTSLAQRMGSLEQTLRSAETPLFMPPLPQHVGRHLTLRTTGDLASIPAGASRELEVELNNGASERLLSGPPYPVYFSYHWIDPASKKWIEFEGVRTPFRSPVMPHSRCVQPVTIVAPQRPGTFLLRLTLVQEGLFWLDSSAHPVQTECLVEVTGAHASAGPGAGLRLEQAAQWSPIEVLRDGAFVNLGFLSDPQEGMLTFVEDRRFLAQLDRVSGVSCVLTTEALASSISPSMAIAIAESPRQAFFETHNYLASSTNFYWEDFSTVIDTAARIHARSFIADRNVVIGPDAVVEANATILERTVLGKSAVVAAGAVVGAEGFQCSRIGGLTVDLIHAGGIRIEEGARILGNAVVARGLFRQNTVIGKGARVGNVAYVSHNARIGRCAFIGHGSVLNGNVTVGDEAWIGPGATIVNGISIGERAAVSLGSTVIRDVPSGHRVSGGIALEHRRMLRMAAAIKKTRFWPNQD